MKNPGLKNLAFIDIEATSADAENADIIEIAFIIKCPEGKIIDHFHSLIKPTVSIPANISELTGICDKMVANAPEFHAIAEKIFEKLKGTRLVAHKAQFDRDILKRKFLPLGIDFSNSYICTLELAKRLVPGMGSYSLLSLCSFFDIPLKRNHRAQDDAEAADKLYQTLSLLSGSLKRPEMYLERHKKLIRRSTNTPGIVTFKSSEGKIIFRDAVESIHKSLKARLELKTSNKWLISKCSAIEIKETGSLARALFSISKNHKQPRWCIYSFRGDKGEVITRIGKVHPHKKALLYFDTRASAIRTHNKILAAGKSESTYAYQEGPTLDKSEVLRNNARISAEIRKWVPELQNLLIRSSARVNGKFQYILLAERESYALFESPDELDSREQLLGLKLRLKKLKPSNKRALQKSIHYIKNQKAKTDILVRLKAAANLTTRERENPPRLHS